MRPWLRFARFFLFLFLLGLLAVLLLAIEDSPKVAQPPDLSPERLARAERVLRANDPRRLRSGETRTVQLAEEDLDLAANTLVQRLTGGAARIRLQPDRLILTLSLPLSAPLAGRYLNLGAELAPSPSGLPVFENLRAGRLRVAGGLADRLGQGLLAALAGEERMALIAGTVKHLSIGPGRLAVTYRWRADLPARLGSAMVPEAELARLLAYRQRLVEAGGGGGTTLSLADLLRPVFRLAGQRSASGDPVAENRAAIVALTFYVNGHGLDKLVPGAAPWPRAALRAVSLAGRDDFPKHFIISAALAITAGTPLSDAIGLYKEVRDSRGGSGFSFNDIAADRAGTRFGETAGAGADAALNLQRRLAAGVREADIMPSTGGLPEFLPEPEFLRRYGGVGAPGYTRMMADIERRVAALPLYRQPD